MARESITAPPRPEDAAAHQRAQRLEELRGRGNQRTPAQNNEAIDLLADEVAALRARLNTDR